MSFLTRFSIAQQIEEQDAFPNERADSEITMFDEQTEDPFPPVDMQQTEPDIEKPGCKYAPIQQPGESPEAFTTRLEAYHHRCTPLGEPDAPENL